MEENRMTGRVTIPTDLDVVPETLEILKKWGADAIRDCDGTDFPQELKDADAKIYSTYYTTRKDNAWAKANPDEVQQCYIMTGFYTAPGDTVTIPLMKGISPELMQVNTNDDITRWWEVMDRTTGQPVPPAQWSYADGSVTVQAVPFHEYTVSFLAYLIWDPVHMYNATTNGWTNFEHQITFDVRQPKTHKYSMERLRKFIAEHPYVNVIRYTTFFHQFTLIFDELKREKFVDWYGYSASVSPYILNQFEQEVGYKFRPEYIIDQGYYNNQYRVPSKEFRDFQAFQRREVAKLAKEMVDITHECGCEAMMFLGDHWIGTEPFMPEFKTIGLDAVVGSVGNGSTLRLISDIEGVKYTEGRFLPYFFPDTFHEGGDPVREAKENWVTARRAILRKPIDRIGYGGYLKLALQFPEFVDYVESVCSEFRELYENIKGTTPYCVKRVAVLNCWGKMRAWGCHMVHHALYYKQNYSYSGVIEMLSGAPFDVKFISFEDIKKDPALLDELDVIINVGDADTAHTGGIWWRTRSSPPRSGNSSGTAAASSAWVSPPVMPIRATFSSWPACWAWKRKTASPSTTTSTIGTSTRTTSFCRMPTSPSTLARARRTSTPSRVPRCWCSGTGKCRWRHTISVRAARSTSAVCLTALPTAAPCTVPSCGAPTARRSCTPGSVPTTMWKCTPT